MSTAYREDMPPPLSLVDRTYGDVDQLSEAMASVSLQLTRGRFQGRLTTLGVSPDLHIRIHRVGLGDRQGCPAHRHQPQGRQDLASPLPWTHG